MTVFQGVFDLNEYSPVIYWRRSRRSFSPASGRGKNRDEVSGKRITRETMIGNAIHGDWGKLPLFRFYGARISGLSIYPRHNRTTGQERRVSFAQFIFLKKTLSRHGTIYDKQFPRSF